jgi:hypothetical protein
MRNRVSCGALLLGALSLLLLGQVSAAAMMAAVPMDAREAIARADQTCKKEGFSIRHWQANRFGHGWEIMGWLLYGGPRLGFAGVYRVISLSDGEPSPHNCGSVSYISIGSWS